MKAKMHSLIQDQEQFNLFVDILPDLIRDEVYFLSLSARNKYLTDAEREEFDLGRTEMFSRQIAFDKEGIKLAMDRMRADLDVRRTRNGSLIPEKCLVVYMNIHPSSTVKAYRAFSGQMDRHYEEAFMGTLNGSTASDMWIPFRRMSTNLMNHIQKSASRKTMVDIDIDGEDSLESNSLLGGVLNFLSEHSVPYTTIQTQGGYHVLVRTEYLSKEVPLYKIISGLDKGTSGEVKFNSNAMVPIPGTLQAGKLVKIF